MAGLKETFCNLVRAFVYGEPKSKSLLAQFNAAREDTRSQARRDKGGHIVTQPLTPDDWHAFKVAFVNLMISEKAPQKDIAESIDTPEYDWRRYLEKNKGNFFGFFDGDKMVGCFGFELRKMGTEALVGNAWLDKEVRGFGLADRMRDIMVDWAKEHPHLRKLVVQHRTENMPSQAIIRRWGFVHTHDSQKSCLIEEHPVMKNYRLQVRA